MLSVLVLPLLLLLRFCLYSTAKVNQLSLALGSKNGFAHSLAVKGASKVKGGAQAVKFGSAIARSAGGTTLRAQKKSIKWLDRLIISIVGVDTLLTPLIIISTILFVSGAGVVVLAYQDSAGFSARSVSSSSQSADTSLEDAKPISSGSQDIIPGIKQEDWDKADDIGQKLARAAWENVNAPYAGSDSLNINNGDLVYQQGDTPVSYYDCSTFVMAVLQSIGYLPNGEKSSGGYDFAKNKKSDLEMYLFTGAHIDMLNGGSVPKDKAWVTDSVSDPDYMSKLVPGDIILTPSHVGIYLGRNESGAHVFAHALMRGISVYRDVELTEAKSDVGLTNLEQTIMGEPHYVTRFSEYAK